MTDSKDFILDALITEQDCSAHHGLGVVPRGAARRLLLHLTVNLQINTLYHQGGPFILYSLVDNTFKTTFHHTVGKIYI